MWCKRSWRSFEARKLLVLSGGDTPQVYLTKYAGSQVP